MPEFNVLNSSCDWCELDVPVRRLVDTFDQPLMSICEACDYQREFLPNNNKKENVMNTHKCYGITKKGEACKKTDVRPVDLLVKQSQAIPAADVNPNNMGAGWLFYGEVPLCGTHAKQCQLTIQSLTRLTEAKIQAIKEVQKEMREFPYATNPGDADMLDMELAELEKQKHILCGNCKSYHSTKEEVRDCYRGHKIVKTAVKNNGVLCGKCKSHHPTPADVKACYTK